MHFTFAGWQIHPTDHYDNYAASYVIKTYEKSDFRQRAHEVVDGLADIWSKKRRKLSVTPGVAPRRDHQPASA